MKRKQMIVYFSAFRTWGQYVKTCSQWLEKDVKTRSENYVPRSFYLDNIQIKMQLYTHSTFIEKYIFNKIICSSRRLPIQGIDSTLKSKIFKSKLEGPERAEGIGSREWSRPLMRDPCIPLNLTPPWRPPPLHIKVIHTNLPPIR